MSQSKILVDTNSYLRLAKTIRPLLFCTFGDNKYCLYILSELNDELSNHKLANKFPWTSESEFVENRQNLPTISKKQKKSITDTFDYVWDYVQTECPGPSKVDAKYIAVALELNIPVVTDDQDMITLASAFGGETMSTLELLKIMTECQHINMEQVRGICNYWKHISDIPSNFKTDSQRLFAIQL